MEQGPQQPQKKLLSFGDRKLINGVIHEYVDTGYTLREYYAHSIVGKGPGPGWDTRERLLDDEWALERFGRTFSMDEVYAIDSTLLPDLPFGKWVPVGVEE